MAFWRKAPPPDELAAAPKVAKESGRLTPGRQSEVRVASTQDLIQANGRMPVAVADQGGSDRLVALFRVDEQVFAVDGACFFRGCPLHLGAVQEYKGEPCVVCPWAVCRHKVALRTGRTIPPSDLFAASDGGEAPGGKNPSRRTRGFNQRVHSVRTRGGQLYVRLNESSRAVMSDQYAFAALSQQLRLR